MQVSGSGPTRPGPATRDATASTLAWYFGDIGDLRVLTRAEEREIAFRFRAHRSAAHALLAGLPSTGAALCDRWAAHGGRSNPLRGLVARPPETEPGPRIRTLAATVRRVQRRLGRTPPLACRGADDEAAWDRFESLQRADLLGLDLSPGFYQEAERTLVAGFERLSRAADTLERRQARDAAGLPIRRLRRRMRELEPLASARDEARNLLARHNLKLVVRFAKQFRNLGVGFPDLIQEGNLGLLRAIELFEPERGLKFSTYAVWWIRQSLVRSIQKQSRTVRLPSHVNERLHQLSRASERLAGRLGHNPTNRELARETGLEAEGVEQLRRLQGSPLSLEQAADPQGSRSLHELLPDPRSASPVDHLEELREQEAVGELLKRLEPRERAILGRRFGLSGEERVTLERLARDLGLSRELVRRIERRALSKLRGWAAGYQSNGGTQL